MTATEYINSYFERTKFQFISVMDVYRNVDQSAEEVKSELNKLASEGKIRKRNGFNFDLIEILNT